MSKTLLKASQIGVILAASLLFSCSENNEEQVQEPEIETVDHEFRNQFLTADDSAAVYLNPEASIEDRITDLMSKMSLEEKCAQMVQGERLHVTPEDIEKYGLGSISLM